MSTTIVTDGPRGHPLTGTVRDVQRDILEFLDETHAAHGSLARVRLVPGWYGYLLSDPSHYRHVLMENSATYTKEVVHFDVLGLLIGRSVVTLNGSLWKRRRRLAQPAFHRQRIEGFGVAMTDETTRMLDDWAGRPAGTVLDIEAEMTNLTLQIASKTLLNVTFRDELEPVGHAFAEVNRFMSARWASPVALWTAKVPTPSNRRYHAAMRLLDATVYDIIETRRRGGEDPGDLLSMLLDARDADTGEGLTDEELRDEVMTILIAGHETSSTALTWAWYLLSQHPEAFERLTAELDEVLGDRLPTVSDLKDLPYVSMVFSEALRLYPPAYVIGRKALLEDRIDGHPIPRGANVYLLPWVTHRRPDLWPEPLAFRPERFAPGADEGRPQHAYIPFGIGPRFCLGDAFAQTESQLILATVAQRFRLGLAPGQVVEPRPLVTIRPRFGMRMTAEPRRAG